MYLIFTFSVLYRAYLSKEPVLHHYIGEATSFFLWYWILYHCYFEYDHLVVSLQFQVAFVLYNLTVKQMCNEGTN